MILVDTSVWVDHWRSPDPHLVELLRKEQVLIHPMVIGELACGHITRRADTMRALNRLPTAPIASHSDAIYLIEQHQIMGRGIGFIDVHLLVSTALSVATELWTVDRRLHRVADELGLAYDSASMG